MGVRPLQVQQERPETAKAAGPLLPTLVVGVWKGGAWKTAIAVAAAELLAWGGLRVLLVTADKQRDAHRRLGLRRSGEVVRCGEGSVTVIGASPVKTIDLLYRGDASKYGAFDVVVVDTLPSPKAAKLPGVHLVVPIDGRDAMTNAAAMLQEAVALAGPPVLLRVKRSTAETWEKWVHLIERAAGGDVEYIPDPVPESSAVYDAHNAGQSPWSLPRRGSTQAFLSAVRTVVLPVWRRARPGRALPRVPAPERQVYVPGWDDDEAD